MLHGRMHLQAAVLHVGVRGLPARRPVMHQPDLIRNEYFRKLKAGPLHDALAMVHAHLTAGRLAELASARSKVADSLTRDATERDELGEFFDAVKKEFDAKWTRSKFASGVQPIASDTEKFNASQLNRTLRSVVSVDVVGAEPWLSGAINEFVHENVALIKSVPAEFFSDLERQLKRNIADGARPEELEDLITDRYNVAESRAKLIARDQVGKFNGDLNRVRQKDLGIERFVWRSMHDNRVRPEHEDRDGETYSWDDPPDGETPGEPVQCRCYADPVLEDLAIPD
jgi:SPP1 gp7 family putative phage head morphogenesis protein